MWSIILYELHQIQRTAGACMTVAHVGQGKMFAEWVELKTSQQTIGYCPKVVSVHSSVQQYFICHSPQFWRATYWEDRVVRPFTSSVVVSGMAVSVAMHEIRSTTQPRQSTHLAKSTSAHARENALSKKSRLYITLLRLGMRFEVSTRSEL